MQFIFGYSYLWQITKKMLDWGKILKVIDSDQIFYRHSSLGHCKNIEVEISSQNRVEEGELKSSLELRDPACWAKMLGRQRAHRMHLGRHNDTMIQGLDDTKNLNYYISNLRSSRYQNLSKKEALFKGLCYFHVNPQCRK